MFPARGRFLQVFSREMTRKGVMLFFPEEIPEGVSRKGTFPGSLFSEVEPEGGNHSEHADFWIY